MLREGLMVGSDPRNSQGMGWITDRLPSEADADVDGDVLVEDVAVSGAMHFPWFEVVLGQGWWSPLAADAASAVSVSFDNVYLQAKLDHLRVQTKLLKLQLRREQGKPCIDLASMSDDDLLELQQACVAEARRRGLVVPCVEAQ